jgi:Terpene synthase family 2, C-terminal metal binding
VSPLLPDEPILPGESENLSAVEVGRICGVAARSQRDLQKQVASHPALFAGAGFDASLLATVTLANAFSAPWLDADQLRMLNRTALWAFALDWQVDVAATGADDLADLTRRCLAVADGAAPVADDPLALFLASLRDDLARAAGFAEFRAVWRDELSRLLAAMTLEWEWRQARAGNAWPVTVEQYLANADNLGAVFVNLGHWISTGSRAEPLPAVLAAARAAQRVVRILNDLATYGRDVSSGDLNVLMLDGGERAARSGLADLVAEHRRSLQALPAAPAGFANFLGRQVEFCRGFYPISDYWGDT